MLTGVITAIKEGTATITATAKINSKTASIKINVHKLADNQKIKIDNLKLENERLSKIGEKVTVTNFKKNFELSQDLELVVLNDKNETMKESDYVGTSTKAEIREKSTKKVLQEYVCIIYGDVNGDGKITAMDYTMIQNHIMEIQKITDPNKKIAADVYSDNKISAMDYTYIQNHIMDVQKITLR